MTMQLGAGASVVGVHCAGADGQGHMLPADLVVDASGRGTPTLHLFQALGRPPPEVTTIGVDIGYASATYKIPYDAGRGGLGVMTFPKAP